MKLTVSNIEGMRASVEALVNGAFASVTMIDVEHMQKSIEARAVLAGAEPTAEFKAAAGVEEVTVEELAQTIVTKSSAVMTMGNQRRDWVRRVRAAQSVAELDAIRAHFVVDNP